MRDAGVYDASLADRGEAITLRLTTMSMILSVIECKRHYLGVTDGREPP